MKEIISDLYLQFRKPLLYFIKNKIRDKNIAEDLLQEVFFSFTLPNIWSPLISWGGTKALFCSACRTNISTQIPDFLNSTPTNGLPWKTFVNDASYGRCSLCDCSC